MGFRSKILLALSLAGVLPVLLQGWLSFVGSRELLGSGAARSQQERAASLARECSRSVLGDVDALRLAVGYLPLDSLPAEEVGTILKIPFRQLRRVNLLAYVDGRGKALAPAVYSTTAEGGKDAMDEAALKSFSSQVPLEAGLAAGAAVGVPYRQGKGSRVAAVVRVEAAEPRLLVAELALKELEDEVAAARKDGDLAVVLDAQNRVVLHSAGLDALSPAEKSLVQAAAVASNEPARETEGLDGARYVVAAATVPELGWTALAGRKVSVALAAADVVRRYTLFWSVAALLVAVAFGYVLSRGVTRPVAKLSEAVEALAAGAYGQRVEVEGKDEIGRLGEGFNAMAEQIRRRDEEIHRFNQELEKRVATRTRELKEAQEQVQRSRRLAALGSLSAGVAHELNNPLTGIIGLTSLLYGEARDEGAKASLGLVLEEGRKMAKIVDDLRQLVDQQLSGKGLRFSPAIPLRAAVDEALPVLVLRKIKVGVDIAPELPEVQGDPEALQRLVAQLLSNAFTAMPRGGDLDAGAAPVEGGAVKLWVRDTGKGIPAAVRERIFDPFFTTKDAPGQVGLGLSICTQIVEAHHGRITVESEEGRGSTFTVFLPAAGAKAHLV